MKAGDFRCVACKYAPLDRQAAPPLYRCPGCRAEYPILHDVPILLPRLAVHPSGFRLARETASQIAKLVYLPDSDAVHSSLQEIFAQNYQLPDANLAAENNYFFNRIPLPEDAKRPPTPPLRTVYPVNRGIRFAIVDHYVPEVLPAGRLLTRNVRILNRGECVISSRGPNPVHLSYHWLNRTGGILIHGGERTPLPIDLAPGRAMTVPTLLRTPPSAGAYRLQLTMVHELVGWLDADAVTLKVRVVPGTGAAVPPHWVNTGKPLESYSYDEDHRRGREIVLRETKTLRRPDLRLLEVGGCCHPMLLGLPYEICNVDIDVQTLQVGQLRERLNPGNSRGSLQYVCADAHALPFRDQHFDAVVLFSALHHFTRPVEVLRELTRLLKPAGFLAVMCEPVAAELVGRLAEEVIRELERGVNEQVFTLAEYQQMFQKAGLGASWAEVDRASFKAILRPEAAPVPTARRAWFHGRVIQGLLALATRHRKRYDKRTPIGGSEVATPLTQNATSGKTCNNRGVVATSSPCISGTRTYDPSVNSDPCNLTEPCL